MAEKQSATTSRGDPDTGLLFGCILDGKGSARDISWQEAETWSADGNDEVLWLHMDRTVDSVDDWLAERFDLSEDTADILVSNETRPRAFKEGQSIVAILRGINFNEGADPDDMIAMQIWADSRFVITLRRRHLQTPRQIRAHLHDGKGPKTAAGLVTTLAATLVANMGKQIVSMNDRIDVLEDMGDEVSIEDKLDEIVGIRRSCLAMKRYMSPQHEALQQMATHAPDWFSEKDKRTIVETIERLSRFLDDIDVSKESTILLQDDLNNRANHQTNRTMYLMSLVAAIFLPLSFLTGLLGINVGGMPGVDSGAAFWVTVVILVAILGVQFYLFKRMKWL